jgi:predicted nucleic acid-binding protein
VIFLDTNVVSEVMRTTPDRTVTGWLKRNEPELVLSSVVIAEISYGIERVRAAERSPRLVHDFLSIRQRFASRIQTFDEESALIYGRIMGTAKLAGRPMMAADGMIAAIALRHDAPLATRNSSHFEVRDLRLIDPWA